MSLEPGLISYAALASLAMSVKKHRPVPSLAFMPSSSLARSIGWLLLGVSLLISVWKFGEAQGVVAWIGQTCAAGAAFVLLLSWQAHWAFKLAGVALAITMPMLFVAA